ncbi:hypothetical protein ABK040_006179 [Willaertia magna]
MPIALYHIAKDFINEISNDPSKLTNFTYLQDYYSNKFAITLEKTFFMVNHTHTTPAIAILVYAFIVFILPKLLPQKGFRDSVLLKYSMIFWNFFLTVLSLFMLLGTLIPYIDIFKTHYKGNFWELVCDRDEMVNEKVVGSPRVVWAYVFALSKYLELIDTLFLVVKSPSRPVPFLHWYHHMTVLYFTWYAVYTQYSVGFCFIIMNSAIHTVMYFYYMLKEMGYNPSWSIVLTIGQISQMFFGILFNVMYYLMWKENRETGKKQCCCEFPEVMMWSCVVMYGTYLYLFVRFFVRRYILKTTHNTASVKPKKD